MVIAGHLYDVNLVAIMAGAAPKSACSGAWPSDAKSAAKSF